MALSLSYSFSLVGGTRNVLKQSQNDSENLYSTNRNCFKTITAMLFNVTDQGIPKVPDNFPVCPINHGIAIDDVELVRLDTIGHENNRSSASIISASLFLLVSTYFV